MNFIKPIKNTFYMSIGQILTSLISFIGFLYIARLLGPKLYGDYIIVGTFIGLFGLFSLTGLSKVMIRESSVDRNKLESLINDYLSLRLILFLISVFLCCVTVWFTNYDLLIKIYIVIFSIQLFNHEFKIPYVIFVTYEEMKYIPIFNTIRIALQVLFSILFIYLGFGVFTLLMINVLSNFFITLVSFFKAKSISNIKIKITWKIQDT